MAPTTRRSSGERSQDPNLRRVVMSEVGEALQTMIPELFKQMKVELKIELGQMMDERITALGANHNQGPWRANTIPEEELNDMTWNDFKTRFSEQFAPQIEVKQVTKEFHDMKQTIESVNEITDKFLEKTLFSPQYVADVAMKLFHYTDMLKPDIRAFIAPARCKTLAEAIEIARTRELDLDRKRKTAPSHELPRRRFTPQDVPFKSRPSPNPSHLNRFTIAFVVSNRLRCQYDGRASPPRRYPLPLPSLINVTQASVVATLSQPSPITIVVSTLSPSPAPSPSHLHALPFSHLLPDSPSSELSVNLASSVTPPSLNPQNLVNKNGLLKA
ncbi:Retrotransposon gag protein [Cynara cardunculus var. scolymus]|uniref:Retrotransposon gag protein n=1 Tax=Cynara cardunculus var. scolymus TaxID=59895 RepID=A0A103Y2W3_CYNCS|nr:Retrotransposon gag protein [Cynara cardunculus var. scolymus]